MWYTCRVNKIDNEEWGDPLFTLCAEVFMANRQTVAEKAEALARPVAEKQGLSLWDTEFVKEGASWYLRYYIDKPDGVGLEDCEAFSREIDPFLDEEDFIDEAYYLEVSSPGIERKLTRPEHFSFCMGQDIRIRLIRPADGVREFVGTLAGYADSRITLETEDGEKTFEEKSCAWVRLYDDTDWES